MRKFFVLVLFLLLLVSNQLSAQATSPYSRFGLGSIRSDVFSTNQAMGGISAGYSSTLGINHANPASYSEIAWTTFEVGANLNGNTLRSKDSSYNAFSGGVNHLAIGTPILRGKMGLSFGLLPFSNVNYNFVQTFTDTTKFNSGKGSLYQFYIGTAYKWKGLSLGINVGYVFGKLDYTKGFEFTDTLGLLNVRNASAMRVNGFIYNIGLQYKTRIKKRTNENGLRSDINFTAGVYGASAVKLTTTTDAYWQRYYYQNQNAVTVLDEPDSSVNKKGKINLPMYFGAGFTIGNETWWIAGVDFRYQNWKKYTTPLNNGSLGDSWRISLGAGIVPNIESKSFLSRVQYKLGGYYGKSEIVYAGNHLSEFGGTLGLSIPVKFNPIYREAARFNLTAEIGSRAPADKNLIRENYYRITFGFTLNNQWFIRRKFD